MTTTARLCRLTGAALLASVLVAPGVAHADPEHRSDTAASDQPSHQPTPQGEAHRADPQPPSQAQQGKPSARPTPAADRPTPADDRSNRPDDAGRQGGAGRDNGDPAGNNGTIKVDYPAPADSGNANRPHPGCSFQLRMFNFDDDQYGSLLITGQAPTDSGTLLTRRILLSNDPAGGGQDVDEVYSFSAADLGLLGTPRANQGWHIKVAVNAEDAPGGAKQKVLWLDCPVADEAAPARAPRALLGAGAVAQPSIVTAELAPEQSMGSAVVEARSESRPSLLRLLGGGGVIRGTALPMTGVAISLLMAAAAAAIVLGAMAVAASRRASLRSSSSGGH